MLKENRRGIRCYDLEDIEATVATQIRYMIAVASQPAEAVDIGHWIQGI